jgi:ABC-type sugar transport system ATPase subunit
LAGLDQPVRTLSGGNQQKVALAKWLDGGPKVLMLDEPTRGVDIGAKEEIYRLIRELADAGMACVMISSELNELLGMCHRIGVMRRGRLVVELDGPTATDEQIMRYAAGAVKEHSV